ncbi:hypothetical protein HY994_04950 [Candidatus Micrarchaeota archaeon]|nr:hypothetical protein [Candidatus Micrarchaeota archaeon]
MLPDVLVASAIFLAVVLSSVALAQLVADFVVWQSLAQSAATPNGFSGHSVFEIPVTMATPLPLEASGS